MKKILFIRPPFEGMGNYKPPHMGIAMMSSYIKKNFGTSLEYNFIDALLEGFSEEEVLLRVFELLPDLIAITVKSFQMEQTISLITQIKQRYNPVIVCGGNHVSVEPDIFVINRADYSIIGEGEEAIVKIIRYEFFQGESVEEYNNIISKNNIEHHGKRFLIEDNLDKYGIPDWSIMDIHRYNENIHINGRIPALPIMASRGCPYLCDFCSSNLTWGTKVRYRSPELVLYEIKYNKKVYGIDNFHFYDDNLMINRQWLIEFLDLLEAENLEIKWICLSRPEIIIKNKDILEKMKKCGCQGFELGFETSDESVYEHMNKKNQKSAFNQVYELVQDLNFVMIEFLIMCFYDGETFQSLYDTYDQLNKFKKSKLLYVSSRYFSTPFMGTEFYCGVEEKGILISKNNRYKYAIFLNFIPFSFLNSTIVGYRINYKKLRIRFLFQDLEHIICKNEFDKIETKVDLHMFVDYFNATAEKGESILDFANLLEAYCGSEVSKEAILEYVGRMLEFAVSKGAVERIENIIL